MSDSFERLAEQLGIPAEYTHAGGWSVTVSRDLRMLLMAARGFPADSKDQIAASLERLRQRRWAAPLPPVRVIHAGAADAVVPIRLPAAAAHGSRAAFEVTLIQEDGREQTRRVSPESLAVLAREPVDGQVVEERALPIPPDLPFGYHRLRVTFGGDSRSLSAADSNTAEMVLILVPERCHWPSALGRNGARSWGFATQLYALRSEENWGHGTFGDLTKLTEGSAELGADLVGVNPLHALFPTRPDRRCPYAPSSRLFLNPLYIDLTRVPDLATCTEVADRLSDSTLLERVAALRAEPMIDYAAVAAEIWPALEALFTAFQTTHLAPDTARGSAFRTWCREQGAPLEDFARFEALTETFRNQLPESAGTQWSRWPASYQEPRSQEVAAFAAQHSDRVDFRKYLQWEADRQLADAARAGSDDMAIGLYQDLAVGFDRDGAEAWMNPNLVPPGISVGCPPDLRNPAGQGWGLGCFDPLALEDAAYQPFIDLLRANMRHAGALRIDHAFQLQRLYWIPDSKPPGVTERHCGGYVHYPFEDLLGLIALESVRNRCLIVAEDLGTIPEGFRERMMDTQALSYRIVHRERTTERRYLPPDKFPMNAAVALATHDQATLAGFWLGRDVTMRTKLDLYPTQSDAEAAVSAREIDRARFLEAIGLAEAPMEALTDAEGRPSDLLILAAHSFLARTPCRLRLVQLDDLFGETEQMNMPATVDAYPNWKRRTELPVETLLQAPIVSAVARLFIQVSGGDDPGL